MSQIRKAPANKIAECGTGNRQTGGQVLYLGLDLGRQRDHTAIAIVERVGEEIWVRHLERVALGTPYPKVVERVAQIVGQLRKCTVIVDATGVGEPVVDTLRRAGLGCEIIAVTITGGNRETRTGANYCVPKLDLIAGIQVALEQGILRVPRELSDAGALARELLSVRVRSGFGGRGLKAGADGYGEHDDLVIAVALACWRAGRRKNHLLPFP